MKHAEIIFGLAGQTLTFDPPEPYRASSPTVQVYPGYADDASTAISATTGSASVDAVSTTLGQVAAIGDSTLIVSSGSSIARDRSYLITSPSGVHERVEAVGVAGTTVTLREPLVNSYESGSTFQGTRITISLSDTWAANQANLTDSSGIGTDDLRLRNIGEIPPGAAGYRVRWLYTVNAVAELGVSYFDLVRYKAKTLVTPLDVDRLFPGWIDRLPPDYRVDQGVALIEEAWQAVRLDALADAQLLRRIRDTQVLADLVKYRANVLAMQNDVLAGRRDTIAYQLSRDLYDQRYVSLIREPKVAVSQTGGGANGEAERLPLYRR